MCVYIYIKYILNITDKSYNRSFIKTCRRIAVVKPSLYLYQTPYFFTMSRICLISSDFRDNFAFVLILLSSGTIISPK